MPEIQETIKNAAEELLKMLEVSATLEVAESEAGFDLHIDSEENALLIGKHGNTLASLEFILALIVAKKLGEYKRLIIEVGGYREEREAYLQDLTERLKEEVIANGSERRISGLKPWERRFIHLLLAENEEVTTESIGEGKDRVLLIKKK